MRNIDVSLGMGALVFMVIMAFVLGILIGKLIYEYYLQKKGKDLQSRIENTENKVEKILEKARKEANKEAENIIVRAEKQSLTIIENLEKKQTNLIEKGEKLNLKEKELEEKEKNIKNELFKVANLSEEEAKNIIFDKTEKEYNKDLFSMIEKIKQDTQNNAKKEANEIIAKTIYRVAVDKSNNFLVNTVEIPSEDYKGKIIGREGRNIQLFQKITGVELSMDDTPGIVKISSFEPEKRFIAKITLEKLIKDGRINPVYIEKYYKETSATLPEILKDIGRETLLELGIPIMNNEILEYIGRFELRYSYGQNLLSHSKEVAKISELLANELGYDGLLAKKAGLLHDIGKIDVNSGESHPKVGADILRKHNMHEIIVNSAESHHFEVPQIHPISWIVTAADAISAGREGVRHNNTERFIERMKLLENLVSNIDGVKKVYIMQAGREIWSFIDEENISDLEIQKINKEIKNKIEENLDYPGVIRIVSIRENKVIDYAG